MPSYTQSCLILLSQSNLPVKIAIKLGADRLTASVQALILKTPLSLSVIIPY